MIYKNKKAPAGLPDRAGKNFTSSDTWFTLPERRLNSEIPPGA